MLKFKRRYKKPTQGASGRRILISWSGDQHRNRQEIRNYGRITLTPKEGKSGEIIEIQGVTGNDETGITPEQVTLVRSMIRQLQCAKTLSRPDLAKKLNDCLSSLNTRPLIGIARKLILIVKSYKSRKQQKIMTRPMTEVYTDASYTGRATMGQVGIIRQKNSASVAVFHWSRKTIIRAKNDMFETKF